MTKRVSLDEIVSKRRASAGDDGKLFKAVILDEPVEKAGYNPDTRSQRFIMSTETTDLYGDVVRQDGIKTDNFERNPVALAYHRHNAPIGWWKDVTKVNGRPKRTEGTITLHAAGTTDAVDEIDRLLAANAIKACSIGFMPLEAEWILDEQGRNTWGLDFKESSLLECSICSVPANPDALAKAAGGDMRLAAEMFERFLDTYCERTAGGIVVRKDFETAYLAMKAPKKTVAPLQTKVFDTEGGPITVTVKTALELDTEEAERQAESFLEKWSKKFGDLFRIPADSATFLETKRYDLHERYREATFTKDAEGNVRTAGKWPELFAIVKDALDLDEMFSRDGKVVTIRCADSIAECNIDHEDEHFLFVSLTRSYDPPPTVVAGSRQKAVVASARMKQSLRERGLLT